MEEKCIEINWETSKENVQPLRSGRKASSLQGALQQSAERNKHLIEERQKFEEEILAGESSSDPLDSWDKYLKWIQQNFRIGENKKTMDMILRKFVMKFLKNCEYRNDPRYINAWITLARISDNPQNIYSYMKTEGLGTKCAAFYIAWAEELETYDMFTKAAAIYQLGHENNAEPFSLLQKMRNAFEMRAARDALKETEVDISKSSPSFTTPAPVERKAFKRIASSDRKPFSISTFSDSVPKSNQNSNILIFDDSECSAANANGGKWADVPNHYKANKENSIKPKLWTCSTVRQSAGQSSRSETSANMSSFSIFEDVSSDSIVPVTPARKLSKVVEKVLVDSKPAKLVEQPLQDMLSECDDEKNSNIVRCFPFEKIYSVMGEFQLEEIIAASRRKTIRDSKEKNS